MMAQGHNGAKRQRTHMQYTGHRQGEHTPAGREIKTLEILAKLKEVKHKKKEKRIGE